MITLAQIYVFLLNYQYFVLFPIIVVEGPIATVIVGFLIAQGQMLFLIAYPLIIIADLLGDAMYYSLGRWGRNFGMKLLGINSDKLITLEEHFNNHSGKTILVGKLAHGIGTAFIFVAGAVKMPFKKFLFYNIIGTIPKSLILILIGYFFGHSIVRIRQYFDYVAVATFTAGIVLLIAYLLTAKKIKKL